MSVNLEKLLLKAKNGDVKTQYILALYYKSKKDGEKSAHWFQLAANRGHVNAMIRLGIHYYKRATSHASHSEGEKKDNLSTSLLWLSKVSKESKDCDNPNIDEKLQLYLTNKALKNFCQAKKWFAKYNQLFPTHELTKKEKEKKYKMCCSYASLLMEKRDRCEDCGQEKVSDYDSAAVYLRQASTVAAPVKNDSDAALTGSDDVSETNVSEINISPAETTLFGLLADKKIAEIKGGEAEDLALKLIKSSSSFHLSDNIGQKLYRFVKNIDPFLALNWCYKCCFLKKFPWAMTEYAYECWRKSNFELLESVAAANRPAYAADVSIIDTVNMKEEPADAVNLKEEPADAVNYFELGLQLLDEATRQGCVLAREYLNSRLRTILDCGTFEKRIVDNGTTEEVLVSNLTKNIEPLLYYTSVHQAQEIMSHSLTQNLIRDFLPLKLTRDYGFDWRQHFEKYSYDKEMSEKN
jgi:hypothetical protein